MVVTTGFIDFGESRNIICQAIMYRQIFIILGCLQLLSYSTDLVFCVSLQ